MPTYTNRPPDQPRGPAMPIRRTPAFKPLVAIATSEDLVGTYTHFHKGKTVPCESPDCEACRDGIPFRWHAYLSAVDRDTGLHFIFECTAQAAEAFTSYRDSHGTLRGCCFQATRLNKRPNGRVLIVTKPYDLTQHAIPKPPHLPNCLAILWGLPLPQVQITHTNPDKRSPQIRCPADLNIRSESVSYVRSTANPAAEEPSRLNQTELESCQTTLPLHSPPTSSTPTSHSSPRPPSPTSPPQDQPTPSSKPWPPSAA